jgi:prefoldin subunit 5
LLRSSLLEYEADETEGELDRLNASIEALRKEMENGQSKLAQLEAEADSLRKTLLRIGGALQVLEEMAAEASPEA